ncbi:MAG TPA: thiol reductant ABC exporter subunit CydD [Nocardioidaceae bacterium]|nr:thiol reductant ABC exporter subunit CydD [Nocardioidaceae bacterium]
MRPTDPRLLRHLRPATRALAGLVAAGVVGSLLLVAQMFAVANLVVLMVRGEVDRLPVGAGLAAAAIVLRALAGLVSDLCAARASATVSRRLRSRLVHAMLELPAWQTSRQRSGELSLLVTRGVAAIDPYLTRYLPALLLAVVLPPLTLVAIATQDLLAAGIVAVTLPLVPVFAILVGMATRDRADRQWAALSALAGHFVDVMKGLPTLVVHGRARAQTATIRRVTDQHRRSTLSTLRLAFASSAVLELVATLSVALVAVVVGLRLAGGSLDLRTALVVLLLAPEAYWPLRRVGAEFHAAAEGTATFAAAEELLAEAVPEPSTRGGASDAWAGLSVRDLRVTYPGRTVAALDLPGVVDLAAQALVAVVGSSGSGKSTFLSTLAGELPVERGSVSAGPVALGPGSVAHWRTQVAWLPQRPWLESGTVRDNLTVARPHADDSELWAALTQVGLAAVVSGLPGGLESPVGEDGGRLSAGQRARLALARAVLADRPLVLVDEPSAHLDAQSERVIVETLTWLARRSTVVVVTHSPVVLAAAHHVVRLGPTATPAASAGSVAATPAGSTGLGAATPAGSTRSVAATPAGPTRSVATPAGSAGSARRWVLAVVLGILASASGVALTVTSGWLITRAAEHPPVMFLMVAIVGVRAFGIGRPLLRYAERLVGHDSALRMLAERRVEVYEAVVPLTPGALGRRRGDVLASVVDDVDALLDDRLRVRSPLLAVLGVSALATAFAGWLSPAAGLLVAALAGTVLLLAAAVRWAVGRVERDVVRLRSLLSARILQAVHGARDLAMWQATSRAEASVDEAGAGLDAANRASSTTVALGRAGVTVAAGACLGGLGLLLGSQLGRDPGPTGLSAPMTAAVLLLPLALLDVIATAPDAAATSVRTGAAKRRLADLAVAAPAVSSPVSPTAPVEAPHVLRAHDLAAGWERTAFECLDLDVSAGQRLGVVGPSGCGKSTLAATLVRFVDPLQGAVTVDGTDLRDVALDDLHRLVGLVDDDPYVFSSSLFENIRLARPQAGRGEVAEALHAVSLGPWLDALPHGLDTLVGEGHDAVSGGERARLGLARALLADNPVLVLDEPTAHLDPDTAQAVVGDVLRATEGRAVVWVTHDSVALDSMDRVVDLAAYAPSGGRRLEPVG